MKYLFGLIIMFFFLNLQAQNSEVPQVVVTGEGTVKVVPDEVVLNASVHSEGMSAAEVKKANDEIIADVIQYLKKAGVGEKNIQTTYVNLNKHYDYQSKTYNYVANQSLKITIKYLDQYEEIMTGLLEQGINRIDGISFKSSKAETLKKEARKEAMADAKQKAEVYANSLGQNIGAAYQIIAVDAFESLANAKVYASGIERDANGSSETIAPGEIEIKDKVQVSFYLYAE